MDSVCTRESNNSGLCVHVHQQIIKNNGLHVHREFIFLKNKRGGTQCVCLWTGQGSQTSQSRFQNKLKHKYKYSTQKHQTF